MGHKILVTGGLGYIGSHTVVELMQAGYEPIIIDNLSNTRRDVLQGIHSITGKEPVFYEGDVCNPADLQKIFSAHSIRAIIHFAAYKAVGESVEQPLKYYRNNVGGLISLLETAMATGVKDIVFSSSCTVYGQPEKVPVTENSPVLPASSPYGNTKQICEEILRDQPGLRSISLRYFNPIGAHPSARIGELPLGVPNNLVPFITQTAAGIRKSLTVFGDDYHTPDGTCIRDYIYVCDLAKAHISAVERLLQVQSDRHNEVFNLGTGVGYSVLQVIKSFEKSS